MRRPGKTWQRELFDPDGPERVLKEGRRQEPLVLLAGLLRRAATRKGEGHELDHG